MNQEKLNSSQLVTVESKHWRWRCMKHCSNLWLKPTTNSSSSSRSRNLRFHSHVNDGIWIRVSVNGTFAPAARLLSLGNLYGFLFVTNFKRIRVDSNEQPRKFIHELQLGIECRVWRTDRRELTLQWNSCWLLNIHKQFINSRFNSTNFLTNMRENSHHCCNESCTIYDNFLSISTRSCSANRKLDFSSNIQWTNGSENASERSMAMVEAQKRNWRNSNKLKRKLWESMSSWNSRERKTFLEESAGCVEHEKLLIMVSVSSCASFCCLKIETQSKFVYVVKLDDAKYLGEMTQLPYDSIETEETAKQMIWDAMRLVDSCALCFV